MGRPDRTIHLGTIAAFLLALLAGMRSVHAQEREDVHPYLTEKFFIDLGIYFPERETRLGVNGSIDPEPSPVFEFGGATGIKDDDETFSMDFGWRFTERWTLLAQYFKSTGASGAALTESVEWGDIVFEEGTNVLMGQEFSVTRLFFGYEFDSSPRHEFGGGLGFHQLKFRAFIQGEAFISGLPDGFHSESVSHEQPFPNFGVWYKYSFSPNWAFRSRFDWLDASYDKYDGHLINASVGVNYRFSDNFGVGANYQFLELDFSINEPFWVGSLLQRLDGIYIYASAYW